MEDKDIEKIAQTIAAKLAEPGGNKLLGCGSASSTEFYECEPTYDCSGSSYECGGAGQFLCGSNWEDQFYCLNSFNCTTGGFVCVRTFGCGGSYTGP